MALVETLIPYSVLYKYLGGLAKKKIGTNTYGVVPVRLLDHLMTRDRAPQPSSARAPALKPGEGTSAMTGIWLWLLV